MMKIKKFNKVIFEEKVLYAIFISVAVISIFVSNYMTNEYKANLISQGFYSNNTQYFTIVDDEKSIKINELYEKLNDSILFRELDINRDVRGILFKGKSGFADMLSGRFFNEKDFFQNKKLAVAGKNYLRLLVAQNDKRFIKINGDFYEVIGIIGEKRASKLDNLLLLNLDSISGDLSGIYAVDARTKSQVNLFVSHLKNYVEEHGGMCEEILREKYNLNRLIKNNTTSLFFFVFMYLTFALSTVVITLSWYQRKETEISVMRLIGFSKRIIYKVIFKRYFTIANKAFLIGLCFAVFVYLFQFDQFLLISIMIAYLSVISFCFLTLVCPISNAMKNNAKELIERV